MTDLIVMKSTELRALVFDAVTEALNSQKRSEGSITLNPYLTCKQAATFLGKTPNAIRQLVSKNQIQYIKKDTLLYFRKEDLVSYLEFGTIKDEGSILKLKRGRRENE